jgi:hypothetical protein
MKHLCAQFGDNQPMSYIDNSNFQKSSRINEIFNVGRDKLLIE